MNKDKFQFENQWCEWIGFEIIKHSKKPFKNKKLTAIVVELTMNPYSNKKGFKLEDNSYIDCHQAKLYNKNEGKL